MQIRQQAERISPYRRLISTSVRVIINLPSSRVSAYGVTGIWPRNGSGFLRTEGYLMPRRRVKFSLTTSRGWSPWKQNPLIGLQSTSLASRVETRRTAHCLPFLARPRETPKLAASTSHRSLVFSLSHDMTRSNHLHHITRTLLAWCLFLDSACAIDWYYTHNVTIPSTSPEIVYTPFVCNASTTLLDPQSCQYAW